MENGRTRNRETGSKARLGDPLGPETQVGPVTTPGQYRKILDYMEIAKSEGTKVALGGAPTSSTINMYTTLLEFTLSLYIADSVSEQKIEDS
jgi:aldehyde dehydrogenase (NAD+)